MLRIDFVILACCLAGCAGHRGVHIDDALDYPACFESEDARLATRALVRALAEELPEDTRVVLAWSDECSVTLRDPSQRGPVHWTAEIGAPEAVHACGPRDTDDDDTTVYLDLMCTDDPYVLQHRGFTFFVSFVSDGGAGSGDAFVVLKVDGEWRIHRRTRGLIQA